LVLGFEDGIVTIDAETGMAMRGDGGIIVMTGGTVWLLDTFQGF